MTQPVVLQLGAGQWMTHSIRQLQQLGCSVHVTDRNADAPGFAVADGAAAIDLMDADGTIAYARKIGADAIFAANEAGALAAAEACAALGLRGVPPDVALNAVDKGKMRTIWREAGLSQPAFMIVDNIAAVPAAAEAIGYPLILKPTRNWGSRGVSRLHSPDDLEWSMRFARENQHQTTYIVEEFIDGIEMTVEGLAQDGRVQILAKSDKEHQPHDRFRVTMSINYPANFPADILARVDDLVAQAALALGIENGAVHAEVMVRGDTVYLIELAARPGGGHIFGQIVEAVSGISMPQALTRILLGDDVDLTPRYQRGACYRFFAPPAGRFISISGVKAASAIEGVLDFGFALPIGKEFKAAASGAERPGYCVAVAPTRDEALALARRAIDTVQFDVEPLA